MGGFNPKWIYPFWVKSSQTVNILSVSLIGFFIHRDQFYLLGYKFIEILANIFGIKKSTEDIILEQKLEKVDSSKKDILRKACFPQYIFLT